MGSMLHLNSLYLANTRVETWKTKENIKLGNNWLKFNKVVKFNQNALFPSNGAEIWYAQIMSP